LAAAALTAAGQFTLGRRRRFLGRLFGRGSSGSSTLTSAWRQALWLTIWPRRQRRAVQFDFRLAASHLADHLAAAAAAGGPFSV